MSQPIKSPLIWGGVDIIATVGSTQELALICDLGRFFCSIKPLPTAETNFLSVRPSSGGVLGWRGKD